MPALEFSSNKTCIHELIFGLFCLALFSWRPMINIFSIFIPKAVFHPVFCLFFIRSRSPGPLACSSCPVLRPYACLLVSPLHFSHQPLASPAFLPSVDQVSELQRASCLHSLSASHACHFLGVGYISGPATCLPHCPFSIYSTDCLVIRVLKCGQLRKIPETICGYFFLTLFY